MAAFLDVCRFTPTAGGTTDWTYSAAVLGYQSPAAAGAVNNAYYRYRAESADLTQWEIGYGAYNSSTGVLARTTVLFNSSGTTAKISFSVVPQVAIVALAEDIIPLIQRSALAGLTLSAAGASSTFGVAIGAATDSTNVDVMTLASAFTKTTGPFTAGPGNGSFDGTGSAPSSTAGWYHVFVIKRLDTGAVDILTSNSSTAPTMPSPFTLFRRIGSLKTDSSYHWITFVQDGDEFLWITPVNDISTLSQSTTAILYALSVPTGIQVRARARVGIAATAGTNILINSPDEAAGGLSITGNITTQGVGAGQGVFFEMLTKTNASAQIRIIAATAVSDILLATYGWVDRRGRDS